MRETNIPDRDRLEHHVLSRETSVAQPPRQPVPRWAIHRRLYDWVLSFAHHKYSTTALFFLSFAESSFFPIPPDVLLMPLVLGARKRWIALAGICSVASIVGGVLGYVIGMFFWTVASGFFHNHVPGFGPDEIVLSNGQILEAFIDRTHIDVSLPFLKTDVNWPASVRLENGQEMSLTSETVKSYAVHPFTKAGALYDQHNFWIVFTAGFTPLPYKVFTITGGVFAISFPIFIVASTISRAARFFLVAALMSQYGPSIKPFIDKYFNLLSILFLLLLVGSFAVLKLLN